MDDEGRVVLNTIIERIPDIEALEARLLELLHKKQNFGQHIIKWSLMVILAAMVACACSVLLWTAASTSEHPKFILHVYIQDRAEGNSMTPRPNSRCLIRNQTSFKKCHVINRCAINNTAKIRPETKHHNKSSLEVLPAFSKRHGNCKYVLPAHNFVLKTSDQIEQYDEESRRRIAIKIVTILRNMAFLTLVFKIVQIFVQRKKISRTVAGVDPTCSLRSAYLRRTDKVRIRRRLEGKSSTQQKLELFNELPFRKANYSPENRRKKKGFNSRSNMNVKKSGAVGIRNYLFENQQSVSQIDNSNKVVTGNRPTSSLYPAIQQDGVSVNNNQYYGNQDEKRDALGNEISNVRQTTSYTIDNPVASPAGSNNVITTNGGSRRTCSLPKVAAFQKQTQYLESKTAYFKRLQEYWTKRTEYLEKRMEFMNQVSQNVKEIMQRQNSKQIVATTLQSNYQDGPDVFTFDDVNARISKSLISSMQSGRH